jgi:hypothetical protein
MEELKISKKSFFDGSPSTDVKIRVMNFILNDRSKFKNQSLLKKYKVTFV